jgi:glycosyltransferase involved in cell wall biosynthesis
VAYAAEFLNVKTSIFVGMGYPDIDFCPESNESVVLFVGNMTQPNRLALSWFLTSVWPTVLSSHPTARFRIVGRVAFSSEAYAGVSVERVGPVRELAPEYRRAQVVVAPLVSGSAGVKIKVAEAMSYGRPLVTTSIGVDNRDVHQLEDGAIVANEPADFARGVISLLSDGALWKTKSAGARRVFRNYFSYSASYDEFSAWLRRRMMK